MLDLVLSLLGVVFIPFIAVLFLTYIVVRKLSHRWFLEVTVNNVAKAAIPAPQATVLEEKVFMFNRPSSQSHETVGLLRPKLTTRTRVDLSLKPGVHRSPRPTPLSSTLIEPPGAHNASS